MCRAIELILVMLVASWSGAETWKLAQLDHTSWTTRDGVPHGITGGDCVVRAVVAPSFLSSRKVNR
jgi:hypothetical protein